MLFLVVKYVHILAAIVAVGLNISYVAGVFYTPSLREQVKLVESGAMSTPEFTRMAQRGQIAGQALGAIVLVILAMRVFKPHL